ncbi:uncharacterized protein MELLADRAFT_106225 [Melampsora larici-populina 98AG31]|uniref:Uncharacterized protein n=1 Tax=Melampsora larici-populina (strain 98AG31 / pathotype 3-4-7) TaxID=747676 RepID=F4RLG4_MELLP|nr:uncharacterized protein MELLADRAFT_106225 [Melampsora larici-populina 98AG31]EGG06763.1 hypothetical protein MELLADRAFT_106225 [Melampsora larici-populina 98AG31]
MTSFGRDHAACTCIPFGCSARQFEKHGETHDGRLFHRTNYPRHAKAIDEYQASITSTHDVSQAAQPVLGSVEPCASGHELTHPTRPNSSLPTNTANNKRRRSPSEAANATSTSSSANHQRPHKQARVSGGATYALEFDTDLSTTYLQFSVAGNALKKTQETQIHNGAYPPSPTPPPPAPDVEMSDPHSPAATESGLSGSLTSRTPYTRAAKHAPSTYAEEIGADIILKKSAPKWKAFSPSLDISLSIQPILVGIGCEASIKLDETSAWRHAGKSFSTFTEHRRNSYVDFIDQGRTRTGVIHHIIRPHSHTTPLFMIHVFRELDATDSIKSPYSYLSRLNAKVVYNECYLKCVCMDDLFGHCAALHNPSGTFGIDKPTVSLATSDMSSSEENIK